MTDRVQVGAHSIAYRHAGSGPPLVFLHGFLCDSRVWRTQLEGLADDFDMIAWDAPGADDSSDPPPTFAMTDWVACLSARRDWLAADTSDLLPSVEALLLWGAEDRRSPLAVAERIHAASPRSEHVVIPDAGHASNMERPDAFNAAVRRYGR